MDWDLDGEDPGNSEPGTRRSKARARLLGRSGSGGGQPIRRTIGAPRARTIRGEPVPSIADPLLRVRSNRVTKRPPGSFSMDIGQSIPAASDAEAIASAARGRGGTRGASRASARAVGRGLGAQLRGGRGGRGGVRRSSGVARGRGRVGRGLSEAAEALLGMNTEFAEEFEGVVCGSPPQL